MDNDRIVSQDELILVTGANGFIGSKVVETLLSYGFCNVRCFARPTSNIEKLNKIIATSKTANIEVTKGNLLSPEDCRKAISGVSIIFHVAAGTERTFAGCFMNSVVTTRNLLESVLQHRLLKRFVNISSFAVYSNLKERRHRALDETCELESQFMQRDGYCFGKSKQDELLIEYSKKYRIPHVILRPGVVYGPGAKGAIHSRVGTATFGIFLHIGGSNRLPLTYIDNCADAIVLAGIKAGIDGEVFNIVDDDPPSSRRFLKMYKKHVKYFRSIDVPFRVFYAFCYLWEKYSYWSGGQLPLVFDRRICASLWKTRRYSNNKLKSSVGWRPRISSAEGLMRHFEYFKKMESPHA